MDNDYNPIVVLIAYLVGIMLIIYCVVLIAGIIAAVAGAGGALWGGGTAIVNYALSFKENMIDSNLADA